MDLTKYMYHVKKGLLKSEYIYIYIYNDLTIN